MKMNYIIITAFFATLTQSLEVSLSSCPARCQCTKEKLGQKVNCRSKNFDAIPNDIPNNTVSLDLSQNLITNIGDSAFLSLSMLTQLTLNNNGIKTISSTAFAGLQSLQSLYMVHCNLTTWHEDLLIPVSNLTSLYLTDNEFETIPNITSPSLSRLFLDKNKFTSLLFPVNFRLNKNLQSVVLSNNNISQIKDDDFVALKDLPIKSLKLSNCKIENISSLALSNLGQLKTLYLNFNGLVSNQLDSILSQISSNLEVLSINNNNITILSANTFAGFTKGSILQVDRNPLNFIDEEAFAPLNQLKLLSLRHCRLSSIGSSLKPLTRLTSLSLSNNSFSEVPNFIPQTLQSLDMSMTRLQVLKSHALKNASNLRELIITKSGLETIESEAFTLVESMKTVVDFSDNFFKCDCSLAWFRNWLNETKVTVKNVEKYLCGSPESLKGKPLLSFAASNCSLQPTTTTSSIASSSPSQSVQTTISSTVIHSSSHSTYSNVPYLTTPSIQHNQSTLSATAIVFIVIGSLIFFTITALLLVRRYHKLRLPYEKL